MLISTKGRYALQVLVDMAEQSSGQYIPLKEVADRHGISEKYLESIIKILVANNIVVGLRGNGGGYLLSRPPEEVTVGEILRLTEGDLSPVRCAGQDEVPCEHVSDCRTFPVWQGLNEAINNYLDQITLQDLMRMGTADSAGPAPAVSPKPSVTAPTAS